MSRFCNLIQDPSLYHVKIIGVILCLYFVRKFVKISPPLNLPVINIIDILNLLSTPTNSVQTWKEKILVKPGLYRTQYYTYITSP